MWPYRLPMLFAVSGILASGAIQQGWGSAKPRRMIAKGLWLYLVWQLIYTGLGVAGVDMWSPNAAKDPLGALWQIVAPTNVLWYLLAIAVWTTVFTLLRGVLVWVQLVLAGFVSCLSAITPGNPAVDHYLDIMMYGVFFGIGVLGKPLIMRWVTDSPFLTFWIAVSLSILGERFADTTSGPASGAGVVVWNGASALVLLCACRVLSRVPYLTGGIAWIGRRTLPVYVLHFPIIALIALIPGWSQLMTIPLMVKAGPLLLLTATVAIALLIHAGLSRVPPNPLFSYPLSTPVTRAAA